MVWAVAVAVAVAVIMVAMAVAAVGGAATVRAPRKQTRAFGRVPGSHHTLCRSWTRAWIKIRRRGPARRSSSGTRSSAITARTTGTTTRSGASGSSGYVACWGSDRVEEKGGREDGGSRIVCVCTCVWRPLVFGSFTLFHLLAHITT